MGSLVLTRRSILIAALACASTAQAATTHTNKHTSAPSPWEQAQHDRADLEAQPDGTRTKAAYARVLDAYRAIYHDNPRDLHAAEAIYTVAELLAEQGRDLEDQKSLRAAVGQYEFLRTQYPFSPLRGPALLAEAKIEGRDLDDLTLAQQKLNQLLKESPHSESAKQARLELAAITPIGPRVAKRSGYIPHDPLIVDLPPTQPETKPVLATETLPPTHKGPLAQVTGIRHWSTATYTRVAIDLGNEVTFEAARVPHPDRIFFDLHGAKLSPELIGKSFDVTDDGFLKRIRAAQSSGDVTRVVLDVNDVTEYSAFLLPNPYRLIIDIHGRKATQTANQIPAPTPAEVADVPVGPSAVKQASLAANTSGLPPMAPTNGVEPAAPQTQVSPIPYVASTTPAPRTVVGSHAGGGHPVPSTLSIERPQTTTEVAMVSDQPGKVEATPFPTSKPIATTVRKTAASPAKVADKTADGETSLIRALGLKINRIVIDAGHGGHDSGTLGVDGIQEKDVVLDIALRLGKLLHERLGAEIIYTRSDDTFIPLETRTAIANKAQADLFLSIHANSSPDPTARGVEVYYLNFTSDPTALDVAARENAVSGQSIHQLSDLVKKITLKDKIAESHEFAADVEGSLFTGLTKGNDGLKNRGVKKAPFVVLIGANMPSILAEISFVTNPRDAEQLRQPEYRERVAESLFNGVAKYENGLAGTRPVPLKRASLQ